jgi:8-oxo-dGTP diphosphatase
MRWVYAIGFKGDRFLMVNNPKRGGWEMPGGKVEEGEDPKDAAVREFREEAGVLFRPIDSMEYEGGQVFAGEVIDDLGEGEMRWQLFQELPCKLAFPAVEYEAQLHWARGVVSQFGSGPGTGSKMRAPSESRIK